MPRKIDGCVVDELQRERLVDALDIIASAYRYDGDDSMSLPDLGLVRAAAVRLWIVLRETGTDVQVVSDLIASAKSDPLPEVRYFSVDESEEAD